MGHSRQYILTEQGDDRGGSHKYAEYRAGVEKITQIQIQQKIQLEIEIEIQMKIQGVGRWGSHKICGI